MAEKSTSLSASSIRRRWSASSSDLRVTFSVAMTVRSATSLRISSSARRVSASMSLRVDSSSSSRYSLAAPFASSMCESAALRERATMSSACSRASLSRARYSSSSSSASSLVRAAALIDSSIARRRLSSASPISGKANLRRISIEAPNAISVQSISPTLGETRKLPPPSSSPPASVAARTSVAMSVNASMVSGLGEEERDQAEDEGVERDGLGQREAEPADRLQLGRHLGLAGYRLDLLAEDDADADAGADRAETCSDAERDRTPRIGDRLGVG